MRTIFDRHLEQSISKGDDEEFSGARGQLDKLFSILPHPPDCEGVCVDAYHGDGGFKHGLENCPPIDALLLDRSNHTERARRRHRRLGPLQLTWNQFGELVCDSETISTPTLLRSLPAGGGIAGRGDNRCPAMTDDDDGSKVAFM